MNGVEIIESRSSKRYPYFCFLVSWAFLWPFLCETAVFFSLSLHSHLVEHLNAEIVLQTISDVNMALDWIRSTFLYIRALKNPSHYGQISEQRQSTATVWIICKVNMKICDTTLVSGFPPSLDRCGIEAKLQGGTCLNGYDFCNHGLFALHNTYTKTSFI